MLEQMMEELNKRRRQEEASKPVGFIPRSLIKKLANHDAKANELGQQLAEEAKAELEAFEAELIKKYQAKMDEKLDTLGHAAIWTEIHDHLGTPAEKRSDDWGYSVDPENGKVTYYDAKYVETGVGKA